MKCNQCGSSAINDNMHGREKGIDLDYCDVCYWRFRAEKSLGEVKKLKEVIAIMCRRCRVGIKKCAKCEAVEHLSGADMRAVLPLAERGKYE